jgi:hypothetical protein
MEATFLVGARELAVFLRALFGLPDGPCVAHPGDGPEELDVVSGPQLSPSSPGESPMQSREFVIGDGPALYTVRPTHKGRPAQLDGPITVVVADPALFDATVQPDGLSVLFQDKGVEGQTTAMISADVRLGPDVEAKSVELGLSAVPGVVDSLEGDFGDQQAPPTETLPPEPPPTATPEGQATA